MFLNIPLWLKMLIGCTLGASLPLLFPDAGLEQVVTLAALLGFMIGLL